jgi:conjugative relaxase-like TrwC/TraI family protein
MLLIWDVTSAADAKDYYGACLAPGRRPDRQGYYSEGQESPGIHLGKLAEELGLAGKTVDQAAFDRLCDNRHPLIDKPLTPRTNDFRRVLKDFTFSGPKSFSIIEAFASEDERRQLRRVFDEAVNETFTEDIEPDMQCRVREGGADHDITTGNALASGFDHFTARSVDDDSVPDPHLHRHLLIWNATRRPDGRIMAGQFGNIVRDKAYYEAAFYSRLAAKLENELGYAIDRRGGKEWEIAGVSQSIIDTFSKRTAQVEAEADRLGIDDAAEKAKLGAKIRARKRKELTLPELRKAWDAQLTDGEREALAAVYRREIPAGREITAAEAVDFALRHLSELRSVWAEREVKQVALLHALGSVTVDQIERELPRQGVIVREIDGRRMATTAALQREELELVDFAISGQGTVRPAGVAEGLSRRMEDGKRLNDGQWESACGLLESPNRVEMLLGPAGAGKTELLKKVDEGMRRAGRGVTYLATTSDAVGLLAKDGFAVNTVARFLLDQKMQTAAKGGSVVIDESSLLGHKDALRLIRIAREKQLKLIFVGDAQQHGSVGRGAFIRVMTDYGNVTPFRLTEIIRQEDPRYLEAAKLLSQGDTLAGFDAIDAMGWVRQMEGDDRYLHMAADYLQAVEDKKSVIVISPTHAEAACVTQAIRHGLREAGALGEEEREFTRLVPVNASEPERELATTYRVGDVIQFQEHAKGGFVKGQRLIVTDPAKVPVQHAGKFSLYRPEAIRLAAGDKLRFTGTVKTKDGGHTLKNGAVKTIDGFTKGGDIRLDNGWIVAADAGHIRYGFVDTSFSSQGKTVHRVILAMAAASGPAINQEQMYVSASRGKERMTLYTDDTDAVRKGIQRSSQKMAALDMRPDVKPVAKPKRFERARKHVDRLRRLAVLDRTRAAWAAAPRQQPERKVGGYGRG